MSTNTANRTIPGTGAPGSPGSFTLLEIVASAAAVVADVAELINDIKASHIGEQGVTVVASVASTA